MSKSNLFLAIRKSLNKKRISLRARIDELRGNLRKIEVSGDSGDEIMANESQLTTHRLIDRFSKELLEVDRALRDISGGEYSGICNECQNPIGENRLLELPFTRVCVDCKLKEEEKEKRLTAKAR
jgi:DnaK suppressor protein